MKRLILEQSNDEFYTSHSGLALVGACINHYSDLGRTLGSDGLIIALPQTQQTEVTADNVDLGNVIAPLGHPARS